MTSRRNLSRAVSMVALVATVLASCSDSSASDDEPDRRAALDQALAELVAMPGGPPGAIVVVQRGSDRSVHAAGVAEVGSDTAPGVDDHMRLASVSKAFSGAAALALVDEGVLSLDDTIGQRLPDLPAAWHDVTLRQLLDHTSGLPDYSSTAAFGAAVTAPRRVRRRRPLRWWRSSRTSRSSFPPGSSTRTRTPTTSSSA